MSKDKNNSPKSGDINQKVTPATDWSKEPPEVIPEPEKKANHHTLNRKLPEVGIDQPVSALAWRVGMILSKEDIFRMSDDSIVTIKAKDGEVSIEPVTKVRFVSMIEKYIAFGVKRARKQGEEGEEEFVFQRKSITQTKADEILQSDQFKDELRPLRDVRDIRLPAWANSEKTKVRLLPPGYDEETQTYTAPIFQYRDDLPIEEAKDFLINLYRDFPWSVDPTNGEPKRSGDGKHLIENRSFSVQLTLCLAAYCSNLWDDMLKTGFLELANQQGTGKTLLARLALCVPFGKIDHKSLPGREEEREKVFLTLIDRPFAFFDNVKGFLNSPSLEAFLTSPIYSGRVLQMSKSASGKPGFVVLTGNGLQLNKDLFRRFLVVELFCEEEDATDIDHKEFMDYFWPERPENRKQVCEALWAILRHWEENDAPRLKKGLINTYEDFTGTLGGLVTTAGFANPLTPCEAAKDDREEGTKYLLRQLAVEQFVPEKTYTTGDILDRANQLNLTDVILGPVRDVEKALGHRLRKYRGLIMKGENGLKFKVEKHDMQHGAGYRIRLLSN